MSKANKMSVFQLTILTAVNMMGSGIIMLPSKLAQVGALSIVSWLVTAVGSMALAYVFAKCGMYSKKGGGMGGYAEYSFGKAGNFLANYTYGVSLIFCEHRHCHFRRRLCPGFPGYDSGPGHDLRCHYLHPLAGYGS